MAELLEQASGKNWTLYNGDACEVVAGLPDESIGLSAFSPPFASLYVYSDSERDMGNCRSYEVFFEHFQFVVAELFRVTKPGRMACIHCFDIPTMKGRDGYLGCRDFSGDIIRAFQGAGWIMHSPRITIWKCPVVQMQRTKTICLLHKQIKKDSCVSRVGLPDYVVVMRKPGENPDKVSGEFEDWIGDESFEKRGSYSVSVWERYASPVWMDINPSRTLQYTTARDDKDERHICPLQLDVIERCLELWSNPGDVVLSPFAGIGSEGHCSLLRGRKFVGVELKPSYYRVAARNLAAAEAKAAESVRTLFDNENQDGGLVVTTTLTPATPAASQSRSYDQDIDSLESAIDAI